MQQHLIGEDERITHMTANNNEKVHNSSLMQMI